MTCASPRVSMCRLHSSELCTRCEVRRAFERDGNDYYRWETTNSGLVIDWHEGGGPPVPFKLDQNFGLRLILDVLPVEFGSVEIDPRSSGIRVHA